MHEEAITPTVMLAATKLQLEAEGKKLQLDRQTLFQKTVQHKNKFEDRVNELFRAEANGLSNGLKKLFKNNLQCSVTIHCTTISTYGDFYSPPDECYVMTDWRPKEPREIDTKLKRLRVWGNVRINVEYQSYGNSGKSHSNFDYRVYGWLLMDKKLRTLLQDWESACQAVRLLMVRQTKLNETYHKLDQLIPLMLLKNNNVMAYQHLQGLVAAFIQEHVG